MVFLFRKEGNVCGKREAQTRYRHPANRYVRFAGALPDLPDLNALRAQVEVTSPSLRTRQ